MLPCLATFYNIPNKNSIVRAFMRLIVPFVLITAVVLILTAGCVAVANKNSDNSTNNTIPNSFAPFSNVADPTLNKTIHATANGTTKLKGPLLVSIGGYPVDLPVNIDNITAGTAGKEKPLTLTLDEGFHTVEVCAGSICEKETVNISFGKKSSIDFSEQLRKDVEFPLPTARIVEYFKNGGGVSVNIEFINPSSKPLTITAEVSCGYDYIDDRTNIKMGDSVTGKSVQYVEAGQRVTNRLDLYFASGHSHNFDVPKIADITVQ